MGNNINLFSYSMKLILPRREKKPVSKSMIRPTFKINIQALDTDPDSGEKPDIITIGELKQTLPIEKKTLKASFAIIQNKIRNSSSSGQKPGLTYEEKEQFWTGVSAWKSMRNLSEIIPQDRNLLYLIIKSMIGEDFLEWREFFFKSFAEFKRTAKPYLELPNKLATKLTFLDNLLFFKYIKPEDVFTYVKDFMGYSVSDLLLSIPKTNLENMARANSFKKAIFVFHSNITMSLFDDLEFKAMKQKASGVTLESTSLSAQDINQVCLKIEASAKAGQWMLLQNFHLLSERDALLLIKKLKEQLEAETTLPTFKIWISCFQSKKIFQTPKLNKNHKGRDLGN